MQPPDHPERADDEALLKAQPIETVERDGSCWVLLGTAHVSAASARAVERLLAREPFDAVAVELCEARHRQLRDPDRFASLDLFAVFRQGKAGWLAASLALSAYQRRLASQLGIEPGAEMRAAMLGAAARQLPLWTIDRDVGVTLRRISAALSVWRRARLLAGLAASLVDDEPVEAEEIERLKQGDLLESAFTALSRQDAALYRTLIEERDRYMAARLRQLAARHGPRRVLVVIGAGHLAGVARHLRADTSPPEHALATLETQPPPSPSGRFLAWGVAAALLLLLAWGFWQGPEIAADLLLDWVLATGGLGALGCLAAGGHPLSVLSAFVVSPLTPLHPLLASGTVSALIEVSLRRPRVADFLSLRDDLTRLSGWWRNRVSRALLNFLLTSMGTALGVYLAGWRMLGRLIG